MYKKIKSLIPAVVMLATLGLFPAIAMAAGASITLSASKSLVASGGSVVVAVYVDPGGTPINAAEADLNYSAAQLQYVGISYAGSALSINAPTNGGGNGSVTIAEGTTSPVSGSALLATVTFKALAGSGSTTISVAGSSSLVSAADNSSVPYSANGTGFKFGVAAAAAAPSATSSAPAAVVAPAAPAPPKDVTPPVISAIKVQDLTPYSATITWTTNEASDSDVDYGLDATYGLSNSATPLVTAHSVVLGNTFLTPETIFHFHVKSADASGNIAASPDQTINIPGVPVTIIVRGADGKPQAGASVTLDNATGTTDSSGSVVLPSGLGNKQVTTTYEGVTIQRPITVAKTAKALPPYQLDLSKQPLNHWMMTSIGLLVVILVLLGIDAVLFGSHFFARLAGLRFAPLVAHLPHKRTVAAPPEPTEPETTFASAEPLSPAPQPSVISSAPSFNGPALRTIDTLQPLSLRTSSTGPTIRDVSSGELAPRSIPIIEQPDAHSPSAELAAQLKKPKSHRTAAKGAKKKASS
jgi:hypothetical protein